MKILKSIICCLAGTMMLTSCNDWLDVNTDPNTASAEQATVDQLLPWCQHFVTYAYAVNGYRMSFACQALTATSRTSRDGCSAQWEPTPSLSTTAYQQFFVGAGPNLDDMYEKGMETGAYHYAAAARLLRAFGFSLMADMYGEMPYTQALGAELTPVYDDGKTIYLGCIAEIEEAIELLGRSQDASVPALSEGDTWNNGDVNKWIKMAYLLKARLLNHMSKKSAGSYLDGCYDAQEILACLNNAMQSNADNTTIEHVDKEESYSQVLIGDPTQTSPIFDCAGMGGGNTTRPTEWLLEILDDFAGIGVRDPRADKIIPWLQVNGQNNPEMEYVTDESGRIWMRSKGVEMRYESTIRLNGSGPLAMARNTSDDVEKNNDREIAPHSWYINTANTERQGDTIYVGFRSGAVGYYKTNNLFYVAADNYAHSTSNLFCRPSSSMQWATYAEACFIRAEVLFRQGNTAEAKTAYINGVRANIEEVQSMLTTWNGDSQYAGVPSFTAMDQADIEEYISELEAQSIDLGKIMTQKFIAMLYHSENWNDMRRMDYEGYTNDWALPYEFSVNAVAGGCLPNGKWRRIMQCSHEINYNIKNLEAICDQLGYQYDPTDRYDGIWSIPVWWDSAN